MNVKINEKPKTLANCSLREFLQQINKIRHVAADFYKDCKIGEIRKHVPVFTGNETQEEKRQMLKEQGRKNLSDILDFCLEKNVDKTIEIFGLMCFKTPDESAEMDSGEFFDIAFDLISSDRVVNFFMKLANSGLINTAIS